MDAQEGRGAEYLTSYADSPSSSILAANQDVNAFSRCFFSPAGYHPIADKRFHLDQVLLLELVLYGHELSTGCICRMAGIHLFTIVLHVIVAASIPAHAAATSWVAGCRAFAEAKQSGGFDISQQQGQQSNWMTGNVAGQDLGQQGQVGIHSHHKHDASWSEAAS